MIYMIDFQFKFNRRDSPPSINQLTFNRRPGDELISSYCTTGVGTFIIITISLH